MPLYTIVDGTATIPDALNIGATAVDRVYQGPEQIWPTGADPLYDLIQSFDPLHHWTFEEESGAAQDYGSDPVEFAPSGSGHVYRDPITGTNRVGVRVQGSAGQSFTCTWTHPARPITLVLFSMSYDGPGFSEWRGFTNVNVYEWNVRGLAEGNNVSGRHYADKTTEAQAHLTAYASMTSRAAPNLIVADAAAGKLISLRAVNPTSTHPQTTREDWLSPQTGDAVLTGSYGPAVMSHVAILPALLTDQDVADLWAAFEA